jgi:ketosteroid isomerase-like protein
MPSHSRSQGVALLASLALCACTVQQPSMSAAPRVAGGVRAQIEQAAARFSEAFNRGDIPALAAMYDTGGVVLAPNAPPMHGPQNIEALWTGARQQGFKTFNLVTDSVEPIGSNHAVELGRYTLLIQPPGQAETTDRGKYMVLWKRQPDGSWKLYRDMFNTSMPPR